MKTVLATFLVLSLFVGCSDDDKGIGGTNEQQEIMNKLATSLHNSTAGMGYFYAKEQGGTELITGIPYSALPCKECHAKPEVSADGCGKCHGLQGDTVLAVDDSKCGDCHGRQGMEVRLGLTDVHRTAGMGCSDCHSAEDTHGDGHVYGSMFQGAIKTGCDQDGCHATIQSSHPSVMHFAGSSFDCSACHVQKTVSCVNCHFESEVNQHKKVPYGAFGDWKFLVKDAQTGKIRTGNIQTVTYNGKASIGVGPFEGHTIYKPSGDWCAECHDNAIVKEYDSAGTMTATWWDAQSKTLNHFKGTIPFPSDWQTALKFDFVTKDTSGNWVYQQTGAEVKHMLFAEPLPNLPPQF